MPYIDEGERHTAAAEPRTPGQLNFAITRLFDFYLAEKGLNYTHLNDCLGAAEAAKAELYWRVARPYEAIKRKQNGDVYTVERGTA